MRSPIRSILLLVVLVAAVSYAGGCASSSGGMAHDPATLSTIVQGVTTTADVQRMLGKPSGVSQTSGGGQTWTYSANDVHEKVSQRGGLMLLGNLAGMFVPVPQLGSSAIVAGTAVAANGSPVSSTSQSTTIQFGPTGVVTSWSSFKNTQ